MSKITSRRGIIKFIGAMVGSIALPGFVKTALADVAPEAEKLEDMEEIFQGLVVRFRTMVLSDEDSRLIESFLNRMDRATNVLGETPQDAFERLMDMDEEPRRKYCEQKKYVPAFLRFWKNIVRPEENISVGNIKIRERNLETIKKRVVPKLMQMTSRTVARMKEHLDRG